jgi:hypothetical protein
MKFIALHASVTRCRPEPPLTKLHNDCGQQEKCARRLAANTDCRPTEDFSKHAYTGYGYTVLCTRYVPLADAASRREDAPVKKLGALHG